MNDFNKNIWAFFIAMLFFGIWTFPIIILLLVVNFIIDKKWQK